MHTLHDFCLALQEELRKNAPADRNPLRMAEAQLTLSELESLLAQYADSTQTLSRQVLQPFQDFLANRWERIQSTDACYPHAPDDPLNQTCLWLARELGKFTSPDQGSHQLLMPGIDPSSYTDDELHEQPLHRFILTDDNRSWISVWDCLDSATGDGILKHTSCLDASAKPKALSAAEQERFLQHSPEGARYYQAIMNVVHLRQDISKGVPGPRVQALVDGLLAGSIKGVGPGKGEEDNSGETANAAIVQFSEFLAPLDQSTKDRLYALKAPGISDSFKDLWDRLSHPTSVKLTDRYCVYLIQSSLQAILNHNREILYGGAIKALEKVANTEKQIFEAVLYGDACPRVQSSYNDPGQEILLNRLHSHPALASTCKKIFPTCLDRWRESKNAEQNLLEQLELLTILKKSLTNTTAGLNCQAEYDKLFAEILGSWEGVLNIYPLDASKGKLLYALFQEPALVPALKERFNSAEKRKPMNEQLHAYAKTIEDKNPKKACECFEIGASFGEPLSVWKLALHHYEKKPRALTEALAWFHKSYPLWTTESARSDTLRYLSEIARQTEDPRASVKATEALANIYQGPRWLAPPSSASSVPHTVLPPITVLTEKIEFLGFLLKNAKAIPREINASTQIYFLARCITESWETLMRSALPAARKGELLHYLLTEPLLANTMRQKIARCQRGSTVGACLNAFGKTLGPTQMDKALACFEQGADLGCRDCRRNLAIYQHRHSTVRNWKKAVTEYERSYALWHEEKDRQDILARLHEIAKQTSDLDARHAAVSALARIYSRRWPLSPQPSDPDAFSHLSEKVDFLNLLDNPKYERLKNTLLERILHFPTLQVVFLPETEEIKCKHGKLLYRMLTDPRLTQALQQIILANNLTEQVGDYLKSFARSIGSTQPAIALECLTWGAKLGSPACLWQIALEFHAKRSMQNLSKAVAYYTESYPLWKTENDRQKIISKLLAIARQNKDRAAARAALATVVPILRKRCSTPFEGCFPPIFDKLNLLAVLKLNETFETPTEEKTIPSEQEQLLKAIRASWQTIFTVSVPASKKGEILYQMLTVLFTPEEVSQHLQDENLKKPLLFYLLAFARNTSVLQARQVYEITAQLGDPDSIWRLGFYQTIATPPNLSKAVFWYEKCYPLYSTKNDPDDVLRALKKIAGQTVDQRASHAALAALNRIYSARWELPLAPDVTAPTVLAEKIDFLNLLCLHRDTVTEEKESDKQQDRLTQQILGSWEEILAPHSSLTEAEQGKLLHALLLQPLLSDTLYLALSEKQLEAKTGHCLQQFASTLESGTQQVFEAYQIGAKLGNSDCMLNLALLYINQDPPLLKEAMHWLEEGYALLDKESQRKEFFERLFQAAQQTTDPAVRQTIRSLFEKIFAAADKSTSSQAEPFSVFSARMDYLSLLMPTGPEETQKQLAALAFEKLLASWEEKILLSPQTSQEKGEILHRLLTHPLLQEKVHLQIRERKLERKISAHLNRFGASLANSSFIRTPKMVEVYKLAATFGNPHSMDALARLCMRKDPINYSEAIAWFGKSYFLWKNNSKRERILEVLDSLEQDDDMLSEDQKQAKKVLDQIYFQNYTLIKTWRKSIALLPSLPRGAFDNLRQIILDDGREKWVPADIASQWQRLTHLQNKKSFMDSCNENAFKHTLEEYSRALTDLQNELQGKTSSNSAVQAYYTLFQSSRLDTLTQNATRMQLRYLATSEAWQDQVDGIVRILEKSSKNGLDSREDKELSIAMTHWVEQFATPAIFLKINAGSQERLLHFILEQVTRGLPLALELEGRLLTTWKGGRNASSRTALIQYYQKKLTFLEDTSEARSDVEQNLARLHREVYNASWQGRIRNNLYQFFTPAPQRRKDVEQRTTSHSARNLETLSPGSPPH